MSSPAVGSKRQRVVKNEYKQSLDEAEEKQELFFEPRHFSDFRLHYRSTTYHLHRATLYKESHYFRELLVPDDSNDQCDQCQKPHSQCISLPGNTIGGIEITTKQLFEFLMFVYYSVNVADLMPWRKSLSIGNLVDFQDQAGKWCSGQVSSISFDQQVVVQRAADGSGLSCKYRLDSLKLQQLCSMTFPSIWQSGLLPGAVLEACDTKSQWLLAHVQLADPDRLLINYADWSAKWDEWMKRGSHRIRPITSHPWSRLDPESNCATLHLSAYFVCDDLLQSYHNRALAYLRNSSAIGTMEKGGLWKCLIFAEKYHWVDVKQICISGLILSPNLVKDKHWNSGYQNISHETLAELMKAYVTRAEGVIHALSNRV